MLTDLMSKGKCLHAAAAIVCMDHFDSLLSSATTMIEFNDRRCGSTSEPLWSNVPVVWKETIYKHRSCPCARARSFQSFHERTQRHSV